MAAAEPEHNLRVHFSTTLPIIVDKPHRHAVRDGEASSAQAAQASNGEQRCECRSIAARGFAREDVGSCHEIRPCVDIGGQAARRNASAVARKTAPGIAAPAGVPRPPACRALFRQGKRIFRTGRRQHLAFGEHAPGPGVPRLAAPPKRHNRRPSYPPPSHKARLGNIRIGQRLSHGARRLACRGPDWAASPQPARFCLLGGLRNWFGFLERRIATRSGLRCRVSSVRFCPVTRATLWVLTNPSFRVRPHHR